MNIEPAVTRQVEKPWGVLDLEPWSTTVPNGVSVGELWFERRNEHAAKTSLLLKILFTRKSLSVQVHPDDDYARTMGLAHGKTEAWYILRAEPNARVAVGLTVELSRVALRAAMIDGSIGNLLAWKSVAAGDVVFVPAGTIHAIGAGIVLVELQQNSNTTFRILDLDHGRSLDLEHAAACARTERAAAHVLPEQRSAERSTLVSCPQFIFERIALPPGSQWSLHAGLETWLYCLSGTARAASHDMSARDAVFAEATEVDLHVGASGVACLVAYPGHRGPRAPLLARRH